MNETFIGIDLGTSGCRACLIDANEQLIHEVRVDLPEPDINGHCVEQDAEIWWLVTSKVLTQLCQHPAAQSVVAISVDATSSTLLVTDENYLPLAPALMYNDSRATTEAELIKSIAPDIASAVHGASSSLSKLLWLRTQYPESKKVLHQADFIIGKLSGRFVSDFNNSLKTGFDPESETWPDWINKLNVTESMLPEVYAPGTIIGELTQSSKELFGLKQTVHIATGTTDSIAGFLATGANKTGDAVTSLGSTIAIKILSDKAINSPDEGIYSHKINNIWLAGGASNTGGTVLRQLFSDKQLQELSEQLDFSKPTHLDYYPLPKTGERFPENNPDKKSKLTPKPDSDEIFLQAILEAFTKIEIECYSLLKAKGAPAIKQLFTVGGGIKNKKWMQYREQEIKAKHSHSRHTMPCFGTALLAHKAYINMKQNINNNFQGTSHS